MNSLPVVLLRQMFIIMFLLRHGLWEFVDFKMPVVSDEDEGSVARLPGGWVAVLNYTEELGSSSGTAGESHGVIERVRCH